jgi:oligopeptide/dipeptide ABC transporter ATP-binding protein
MNSPLLQVVDLKTLFLRGKKELLAVNEVSFSVEEKEIVCLVGESGCGKSVTALSIMRLISPPGRIAAGRISFRGKDLLRLSEPDMRKIRGNEIAMIFQEPMVSLNPVLTISQQVMEAIRLHQGLSPKESLQKVLFVLDQVGFPDPSRMLNKYPFELSGGLRQRAMIAMALSCQPSLLIADEPTTALDVTIQNQILELIRTMREKLKMAVILITHDLGVVAEMAERVAVMYAGEIIEMAGVEGIFENPLHPYTQALHRCIPHLEAPREELHFIPGMVPELGHLPQGCPFSPRCDKVEEICGREKPMLKEVGSNHFVTCWLA